MKPHAGHPLQAKQDATSLQEDSKVIKEKIKNAEEKAGGASLARDKAIEPIGNLVHDSVPISNNEVWLCEEM